MQRRSAALSSRIANLFAALRAHNPARPAVSDAAGTHSYGSLVRRAAALSHALRLPPTENDQPHRVAVFTEPHLSFVAALLAAWAAPAAAVPLSPLYPPNALEPLLDDAHPAAIITETDTLPGLPHRHSSPIVLADRIPVPESGRAADLDASAYALQCDALSSSCSLSPRDSALIMFTSGTTGRSKGVVWRHSMLSYQVRTLSSAWRWTSSDRVLNVLPLHHIHGLVNVVLTALYAGAHIEMHPSFDASSVWDAFMRSPQRDPKPPTVFMAVPAVYAKLIRAYESAAHAEQTRMREGAARLRLFVCGSASLSRRDFDAWERISGRRLLERYGMTETGMTLSNLYDCREQGLLGYPLPGVEVRVDGDGADGEEGQLLVRGPGVFREYWGRPEATRETFTDDGWLKTGDVVRRDGESGAFTMMGRASSDIIKTGGYKVSAIEIEEVLRDCPGVADCSVVGVEDDVLGQCIVAALIAPDGDAIVDKAKDWAEKNLPKYKVPRRFLVVEDLPRNVLGKVQKQVLKVNMKERVDDIDSSRNVEL